VDSEFKKQAQILTLKFFQGNKMKNRWISSLLLCAILSQWLIGCAKDELSDIELSTVDLQSERIPIHWLFVGGKQTNSVINSIVETFNSTHENIELVVEIVHPSTWTYKLDGLISTRNLPDIIGPLEEADFSQLMNASLLVDDVSPILEGKLGDIDPEILDIFKVNRKLAGLPVGIRPSVLYYNQDLFDKAGIPYPPHQYGMPYADGQSWTIEKMENVAIQLTRDANGNSPYDTHFDPQTRIQYGFSWHWMNGRGLVLIFDADPVVNADGNVSISKRWREGYHWYYDGIWLKDFIPEGNYQTRPAFFSGSIGMIINNMWYLNNLSTVHFKWNLAAIPSYQGETSVDWLASAIFVSNTSPNLELAVETAYELATNVNFLTTNGYLPAYKNLEEECLAYYRQLYPEADFTAVLGSLGYLGNPASTSLLPNQEVIDQLFDQFRDRISTVNNIDLDREIDQLQTQVQEAVMNR
jgi:multiple sugar transport system substrate-binding protein